MRAIFLILVVFGTFTILLGYASKTTANNPLGNALIFGGFAIYLGVFVVWLLFKTSEKKKEK